MTAPRPLVPLVRLRRRLTAWYVLTFGAILLLLGGGLFAAVRYEFAEELDADLRSATTALARAARIRESERGAQGQVMDAVEELHIPDRALYLLDTAGRPLTPDTAAAWVRAAARQAATAGAADSEHELPGDVRLRLHAQRFTLHDGDPLVAVAVADRVELEDRYAWLIAAFGAAAALALVLVAGGGWFLVRKSTEPVERTIGHMRRFMADAAHELRTPITVMRSQAEIALQQERDATAYADALRGVEAESRRLGRIVDDLLTLARADSGERPMQHAPVYLDDVVLDAAEAARALAIAGGVRLEVEEYEEAAVIGDAGLLHQLVMILLDNAIKFTPAGGRVSVRVGADARGAQLVVHDTGPGIPPDQLPHVFERFWRGDPARRRRTGATADASVRPTDGAGLGLAIARWIAEVHGGEIRAASPPDGGARFTVQLPRPSTAPVSQS